MAKTFKKMSRDERADVVREDMKIPGNSNKKLAAKYGVNPGVIAGIRRDYGIPSTNEVPTMGKKSAAVPKMPGLMEAKSEASRCEYPREHCPYEAQVGSRFCPLHKQETKERARH